MALRAAAVGIALLFAGAASAWVLATERREASPVAGFPVPRELQPWPLTPQRAAELRNDAFRRAAARLASPAVPRLDLDVLEPWLTCRFLAQYPSGTSPKFDCVLEDGEIVKIKYGRNPEVAAEVAATRLITALGYAADRMSIAQRVRCHGCPRYPFFAMRLLQVTGTFRLYPHQGDAGGYSEFQWAAVERKFEAASIELPDREGWAWWELNRVDESVGANRVELDAMRLLAVFLAHWDNKDENQRLVCLDPPSGPDRPCRRPLLMMQDLGATFGPAKANVARWATQPVWADPEACTVSMKAMPFRGGTFPDARITDAARRRIAGQLAAIPSEDIRGLFAASRFPEHYSGTDDEKDLTAWTAAFRQRVEQIRRAGPCPQ